MDSWLIARYQSLVSGFSYKPNWWIEQCAYLIFMSGIFRYIFRNADDPVATDLVIFALDTALSVMAWIGGRHELAKSMFSYAPIRMFFAIYTGVVGVLYCTGWIVSGKVVPTQIADFMLCFSYMSCYYFAACEPPPPPKPRTKLALEGNWTQA